MRRVIMLILILLMSSFSYGELLISPPVLDLSKGNTIYVKNTGNDVLLDNGTIIKANSTYIIKVNEAKDVVLRYNNIGIKVKVIKPIYYNYWIYVGTTLGIGLLVLMIRP